MVKYLDIRDLSDWSSLEQKRVPYSFDLEVTARCNNDCSHCYINVPAADAQAKKKELSLEKIDEIAQDAVALGSLWCLVSGGEPLLRPDFEELYITLKRRGLLVSVYTNGTMLKEKHARLFKEYPPRDLEITVYGATEETYDRVARKPGMYKKFIEGLDLLDAHNIPYRLKAMVIRSNYAEQALIQEFCEVRGKDYARFDPNLHLRFDRSEQRNADIRAERLTLEEMAEFDRSNPERWEQTLDEFKKPAENGHNGQGALLRCSAGTQHFSVSWDGTFRLCPSLWAPGTTYDLNEGRLLDAWNVFAPQVFEMIGGPKSNSCWSCANSSVCFWCPARAYLETGSVEGETDHFCSQAHAKVERIRAAIA